MRKMIDRLMTRSVAVLSSNGPQKMYQCHSDRSVIFSDLSQLSPTLRSILAILNTMVPPCAYLSLKLNDQRLALQTTQMFPHCR